MRYQNILQEFFDELDPEKLQNRHFPHDERLISSHADYIYPPRSPDLTPCDYFFFPTLKNTIFAQAGHRKVRIMQEYECVQSEVVTREIECETLSQFMGGVSTFPAIVVNSIG